MTRFIAAGATELHRLFKNPNFGETTPVYNYSRIEGDL